MEMCLYLINHLVDNYGTDPQVTALVDDTDIWIMPLMNPDGNAAGSRYNANGTDLNRDFLARELQELRRLKDETVVPVNSYEKAKKAIFSHKAFSAVE